MHKPTPPDAWLAEEAENPELIRAKIISETARINWLELQKFYAAGSVISVEPALDLVEAAFAFSCDDKARVADWLAAGGISPGYYAPAKGDITGTLNADALLSVTPPPQMPATMEAGTIDGYCVGEPWNQQAVLRDLGVPLVTNYDIHTNLAEKIFGVSQSWAERYPETHFHLVKALIRAGHWLDADNNANRAAAAKLISQPYYVGADEKVIANSMSGVFAYARDDIRATPDFNVFFRYHATYPYYSDAVWYLSQMRRWGQISEAKPDSWYQDIAKQVFQPALYQRAAKALIAEGKLERLVEFAASSRLHVSDPKGDTPLHLAAPGLDRASALLAVHAPRLGGPARPRRPARRPWPRARARRPSPRPARSRRRAARRGAGRDRREGHTDPPAPPLFSTMTDCFIDSPSICAKGLATISVGPPGGKGTISLMDLAG